MKLENRPGPNGVTFFPVDVKKRGESYSKKLRPSVKTVFETLEKVVQTGQVSLRTLMLDWNKGSLDDDLMTFDEKVFPVEKFSKTCCNAMSSH